jgi:hypothetical protein
MSTDDDAALEAWLNTAKSDPWFDAHMSALVESAVKAERAACAQLCDDIAKQWGHNAGWPHGNAATQFAAAIRARGTT